MPDYAGDFRWQKRFIPTMKRIVGEHLVSVAPPDEDAERNTDLIVLKLDAVRIACRVRRHHYLKSYGDEFTIREGRPSGAKTELTKIVEGWGDYFLYGFSNEAETDLCAWILGDLAVFRLWFMRQVVLQNGRLPGAFQENADESSSFRAFRIEDLPLGFLVAAQNQARRKVAAL